MNEETHRFEELTFDSMRTFLERFADERRTGALVIRGEGAKGGRVEIFQGMIVRASSPFVRETIGEVARKLRFVTRSDIHRALEIQSRPENEGRSFGEILVAEGLLSRGHLEMCLRYQVESTLYSLLGFHGRISFSPGSVKADDILVPVADVLIGIEQRLKTEELGEGFLLATGGGPLDIDPGAGPEYASALENRRLTREALAASRPSLGRIIIEITTSPAGSSAVLLRYARHYGRRVALFAAGRKGLRLMSTAAEESTPFPDAFHDLSLGIVDPESVLHQVLNDRNPYVGPFQIRGEVDQRLADALGETPSEEIALFPIALGEQPIGLLYADGLVLYGNEMEDLQAAVSVTALAMENKLLTRGVK